jgi:hypothetical protein
VPRPDQAQTPTAGDRVRLVFVPESGRVRRFATPAEPTAHLRSLRCSLLMLRALRA